MNSRAWPCRAIDSDAPFISPWAEPYLHISYCTVLCLRASPWPLCWAAMYTHIHTCFRVSDTVSRSASLISGRSPMPAQLESLSAVCICCWCELCTAVPPYSVFCICVSPSYMYGTHSHSLCCSLGLSCNVAMAAGYHPAWLFKLGAIGPCRLGHSTKTSVSYLSWYIYGCFRLIKHRPVKRRESSGGRKMFMSRPTGWPKMARSGRKNALDHISWICWLGFLCFPLP